MNKIKDLTYLQSHQDLKSWEIVKKLLLAVAVSIFNSELFANGLGLSCD